MSKRTRLLDSDLGLGDPFVRKADVRDLLHQPLNEHRLSRLNVRNDALCDRPIVDGILDVVRLGRRAGIHPHRDIHKNVLLVHPLISIDPDDAPNEKIANVYLVHH